MEVAGGWLVVGARVVDRKLFIAGYCDAWRGWNLTANRAESERWFLLIYLSLVSHYYAREPGGAKVYLGHKIW